MIAPLLQTQNTLMYKISVNSNIRQLSNGELKLKIRRLFAILHMTFKLHISTYYNEFENKMSTLQPLA